MIEGKLKPDSTVDIWLKDLNIVTDEAELLQVPVWYSSYVLQANVLASSFGWGLDDDSRCVSKWHYFLASSYQLIMIIWCSV